MCVCVCVPMRVRVCVYARACVRACTPQTSSCVLIPDSIEANVESAEVHVDRGAVQLQKAAYYQVGET